MSTINIKGPKFKLNLLRFQAREIEMSESGTSQVEKILIKK